MFFSTESSRPSSPDLITAQQTLLAQPFTDELVKQISSCCIPAEQNILVHAPGEQPQATLSVSLPTLPCSPGFLLKSLCPALFMPPGAMAGHSFRGEITDWRASAGASPVSSQGVPWEWPHPPRAPQRAPRVAHRRGAPSTADTGTENDLRFLLCLFLLQVLIYAALTFWPCRLCQASCFPGA